MLINIGNLDPEGAGLELIRGGAGTLYATVGIASGITQRYGWVRQQIFTRYLFNPDLVSTISSMTGGEPSSLVREFFTNSMFWGTGNYYYMLDSEPAELTRGLSFTIQTSFASKQWIGDLSEARELSSEEITRLAPQLIIAGHLISSFVNEPNWGALWAETSPSRVYINPGGFSQYSGFITLKGETLEYNLTRGWYSPLPRALVRVSIGMVIAGTNYFPYPYPFNKYVTYSDENGQFEIHGLSPYPFIPGRYIIDAWVINETCGKIIYAPDMGVYGAKVLPPIASPLAHPDKASIVLMKVGGAITLYDVFDPRTGISGLIPDLRAPSFGSNGGWFYNRGAMLMPQDFSSKGEPLFYGVYYNGYEPSALVFGLSGSKMMVMAKSGGVTRAVEPKPFLVLVNNSQTDPEGYGITLSGESPSVYDGNALIYAEQIILLTSSRYEKLSSRGVRSVSIEEKLTKAEQYLNEAKVLYERKKYNEAYSKALVAWAWGSRTYEEVMVLIDDSGRTSLFYFALIIPAAILMERLLVHSEGKRQLLSIIALGGLMLAFFALVHPALTVMTNSTMAILGLIAFTLFVATAGILADATQKILKEISYKVLGVHTIETERVGIVATAFTVSIENMRRRWFRTLLVFINLVSISFALTSLTSISPYIGIKYVPWAENLVAPYSGILVKSSFSAPPSDVLGPYTTYVVQGVVGEGAMMLSRSWCYPSSVGPNIGVVTNLVSKKSTGEVKTYQINAMLGLTPTDISYTLENYSITPMIFSGEKYFCIIPDTAARALDVTLGDRITVQGISFRVSGIYNATLITPDTMRDLSGLGMSPTDPYYVQALGIDVTVPLVAGQQPPQLSWSRLIIIPYDVAIELGGYVAEVSIRFTDASKIKEIDKLSADLASILNLPVYVGFEGKVRVSSRVSTFSAFGLEGVIMLLAIGSLNVIATLIGIQRERIKDMYTYTTVGLTPTGAITMVMLESSVYSLLGILIGYFLGFIGNDLFRGIGILPVNFTFNYASLFAMASLLITLISALVASVYPAYSAAKLVTVSLERKWKPPTKPKRGHWEIPLPVKITEVDEVGGLLTFLREYYLGAGTEKPS
ncbi:MAG: FtsX-like permease family protein, partial [Candidatus Bathyarchaeia archaeon]